TKMCDSGLNIMIVGDMGVGKSSLLRRFLEGTFSRSYRRTVIIDIEVRQAEVNGKKMLLVGWDTTGNRRHHDTLRNFYCDAHGVIVVYDITSFASFRNVCHWLKEVRGSCPKEVNVMMVGNKCDWRERRQVSQEKAIRYARRFGVSFSEASARSGANVRAIFGSFALEVYSRMVPSPSTSSNEEDDGDWLDG
ncbi:hypothetical protein KR038_003889, partial [Drosophila bunnanda]